MSLLRDKRIQKLLAQQAAEEDEGGASSSGEDTPITFSSKFAVFKKNVNKSAKSVGVGGSTKEKENSHKKEGKTGHGVNDEEDESPSVSSMASAPATPPPVVGSAKDKSLSSVDTEAKKQKKGEKESEPDAKNKNEKEKEKKEKPSKKDVTGMTEEKQRDQSQKEKKKKKEAQPDRVDDEEAQQQKAAKKSKKSTATKSKKKAREEDDESLLNAILGSDRSDDDDGDGDAAMKKKDAEEAGTTTLQELHPVLSDERAVLSMVSCADTKGLDCRDERIKNFGRESVPDVSGEELRRNGIPVPKIKKGPFATPNLNSGHWYTLGTSGGTVELKKEGEGTFYAATNAAGGGGAREVIKKTRAIFSVDVHSKGYQKAQAAFDFTINTAMGDVNALFACWQEHPYHLPMLLQLSQAFHVTGDTSNANLYMDMSLHVVGMLLGSSSFGLGKSLTDRTLPYHMPANKPVFMALARGMHSALRQGGVHTAFEMSRVLLGLDEHDPEGAALMLDVTAVRSREWLFLIELQHRLIYHALSEAADLLHVAPDPSTAAATGTSASTSGRDADDASAFATGRRHADPLPTYHELVGLPGIHFNAALARHMYMNADASASPKDSKREKGVKGNRSSGTAAQRALIKPSGATCGDNNGKAAEPFGVVGSDLFAPMSDVRSLANAIALFPQAALDLAEAIEEKTGQDPWLGLVFMNEDAKAFTAEHCGAFGPFVEAAMSKVCKLFAVGSKQMWKSTQHAKFLRDAASLVVEENLVEKFYNTEFSSEVSHTQAPDDGESTATRVPPLLHNAAIDVAASALGAHVRRRLGTVLHDRYAALPEESVTGVYATQIPRELLEAAMEEDMALERQERLRYERVTQQEARLMERYEAAFGPLDPRMSFAERMEVYGGRLEEHVRALGQDEGAVRMFLRTLLPWNDVQEMALRRAFEEAGVEDPVTVARRMQRQQERDIMDRADALGSDEDLPEDQW